MNGGRASEGIRNTAVFCTTKWTEVLQAATPDSAAGRQAFGQLYSDYWFPLYAFIRRRGSSPPEAEDVTQNFFARLLEKQALAGLERDGGKFRSFLLRSLENFLANEWHHRRAQKRGGHFQFVSIDAPNGEARYALEPPDEATPETLFERQWAFTLLTQVMERLAAECEIAGRGNLFRDLRPHLQGDHSAATYAILADRHQTTEGAIKITVHRLRQRYGEILREEVARTVNSSAEIDDELRYLIAVVGK